MRLMAAVTGNLRAEMQREVRVTSAALRRAVADTGRAVQGQLRDQARGAGFADAGRSIANAWRLRVYPESPATRTFRPAAFVTSNMPEIVEAFDRGATILPQAGGFLAIPLPAAGRGPRGRRITPREYEQRTGLRLRMVYRRGRPSLLVADNARLGRTGIARGNTGRRRGATFTRVAGRTTIPVFVLLPRVKLRKMLNVSGARGDASGLLAANLVRELGSLPR